MDSRKPGILFFRVPHLVIGLSVVFPVVFQNKLTWLGGSVVRALACDRKVASSTPGQSATE